MKEAKKNLLRPFIYVIFRGESDSGVEIGLRNLEQGLILALLTLAAGKQKFLEVGIGYRDWELDLPRKEELAEDEGREEGTEPATPLRKREG